MWSRVELPRFHMDKELLSAKVTKGDGSDANHQASTSTSGTKVSERVRTCGVKLIAHTCRYKDL